MDSLKLALMTLACFSSADPAALLDTYPRPPLGQDQGQGQGDFAYTEVMTPYYHYYFYSPYQNFAPFKNQEFQNFAPYQDQEFQNFATYQNQEFQNFAPYQNQEFQNFAPYQNQEFQNLLPWVPPDMGNPNENTYQETYASRPTGGFPLKANVNPVKPGFSFPSFLPTVLAPTSNIVRNEDQGKVHNELQGYAHSYKSNERNPLSNAPSFNTPLLTSNPNIIRGEIPQIINLFKPASDGVKLYSPSIFHSTSKSTSAKGEDLNYLTLPTSPSFSTTPSIKSDEPSSDTQETLVPLFTSEPPLDLESPPVSSKAKSVVSPVLFEAPGHPVPP